MKCNHKLPDGKRCGKKSGIYLLCLSCEESMRITEIVYDLTKKQTLK